MPGAIAAMRGGHGVRRAAGHTMGWGWAGGIGVRHRARGGEHRGRGTCPVGLQRAAHAGRAHRRRLAGGRGHLHGAGARPAAGALRPRASGQSIWMAVALTALKVSALVAFTSIVGARVIPRVLDRVAATRSRELFTLTVLVIALGIAVGSAQVFGVSMALGAFLAGMVVGRSDYSLRAASDALPMRDAFAVLFFVSVGMLLDPASLFDSPWLFAGTLAIVLDHQSRRHVRCSCGRCASRSRRASPWRSRSRRSASSRSSSRRSAASSASSPTEATNTIIAASIVSIVLNPLLYRIIDPVVGVGLAASRACRGGSIGCRGIESGGARAVRSAERRAHRAVLIGYGPTGRTVARMLKENGIEPTVIEINIDTVRELREMGADAVYGDATRPETLDEAGIAHGGQPDPDVGGHGEQHRGDPRRARGQSRDSRAGARVVPARPARPETRRGRHGVHRRRRGRAGVRRRNAGAASAPPPSKSIASAPARTRSCSATARAPDRRLFGAVFSAKYYRLSIRELPIRRVSKGSCAAGPSAKELPLSR